MAVAFPGSPRPTLGVEWEIALVDKTTRDLSNSAAVVFDEVNEIAGQTPRLTKEFLRNTVELVTDVHDTVAEAVDDLSESLSLLRRAADQLTSPGQRSRPIVPTCHKVIPSTAISRSRSLNSQHSVAGRGSASWDVSHRNCGGAA